MTSSPILTIGRPVGAGHPPFVIAELSANHLGSNVRLIRPGFGMPPRELPAVLGKHARVAITRGTTPLAWELIR